MKIGQKVLWRGVEAEVIGFISPIDTKTILADKPSDILVAVVEETKTHIRRYVYSGEVVPLDAAESDASKT